MSHPAHSAPSHSFRTPYHSHSAPGITVILHPMTPHALNPVSVIATIIVHIHAILFLPFLLFPCCSLLFSLYRLLYSISILIFFVSISVQTHSDLLRTCTGQTSAVSPPMPCQSFCTHTPRMPYSPFSAIASVIVRMHARKFFFSFFFFFSC